MVTRRYRFSRLNSPAPPWWRGSHPTTASRRRTPRPPAGYLAICDREQRTEMLTFLRFPWALLRVCASGTGHSAPPVSPDTGQDFPLFPQRPRQFPQLRTPATFESVARHFRLTGFRLRSGGPLPRSPFPNRRRLSLPPFRCPAVHWVIPPKVCLANFRFPAPVRGHPPGGRC